MTEALRLVSAIDHNYVIPWSAMIVSLRHHNQDVPVDAFILHYDLTENDITYIQRVTSSNNIALRVIKISSYPFSLFHTRKRDNYLNARTTMSPIAYAKAFVDSLLPADIDRIVTIDADMIISNRIDELLAIEIPNPLAAVANVTRQNSRLFNSGLMLIDLVEWRQRRISDIARRFLLAHSEALHTHDQHVLNLIFGNDWSRLHPKWNYMEDCYRLRHSPSPYSLDEIEAAHRDPVVIHYKNSGDKPWRKNCTHPRAQLYNHYVEAARVHRTNLTLYDPADNPS